MNLDNMISLISKLFFLAAFVLLGLGVIERVANAAGYTIMPTGQFSARRFPEIAAVLLIFVIAIQLRAIKEELKRRSP